MDYGINVQAVSDKKGCFIYFAVAAPGLMHDSKAYQETTLPSLVENLPQSTFIVADNAYTPTEHLVPVYVGIKQTQVRKQLAKHVEPAGGSSSKLLSCCELVVAFARFI